MAARNWRPPGRSRIARQARSQNVHHRFSYGRQPNSTFQLSGSYIRICSIFHQGNMGKKAKSTKGAQRAQARKLDKSTLPPPPKPVTDEVRHFWDLGLMMLLQLAWWSRTPKLRCPITELTRFSSRLFSFSCCTTGRIVEVVGRAFSSWNRLQGT
jgi:hypothetical protein